MKIPCESISLINKHGSHEKLLKHFDESKSEIIDELKKLFLGNEFKLINTKYFSSLLNNNNSLYLFMGILIKYIQREYISNSTIPKKVAKSCQKIIAIIKINFFNIIMKKKQEFKMAQKIYQNKLLNESHSNNNSEINCHKNSSNITQNNSFKKIEPPELEYTSTFLKLISDFPQILKIIKQMINKYFKHNEKLEQLIIETIRETNKEKMNNIINLSRSLAIIKTNTNDKVFAVLNCLFKSNDLLRPVSFPEIQDAFLNVQKIIFQ